MSNLQFVKKQFMAMRNGVLADQLRVALNPSPYTVVFGLMVPQISQIAAMPDVKEIGADALWEDAHVRESRLLACYLFNPDEVSRGRAEELMEGVQTKEEADMLAFRLLKRLPFAHDLVEKYRGDKDSLRNYAALTLERKL